MIQERDIIAATNTDLLAGGRLNSIPYAGTLTVELQSQFADATNQYRLTLQLPNGDVPIDNQLVPGCNPAIAGVIDDRTKFIMSFRAASGGHFVISLTETGTAVCTFCVTLTP